MFLIYLPNRDTVNLTLIQKSRASMVSSAAMCAALYALVNALTSFVSTPWGIGEFRPGVVIPAFFAIVSGPIPAAIGAGVGSFVGDMVTLVPEGRSTFIWAIGAGGVGNFLGFLVMGWVFQKLKTWRGFVAGTTSGLFVGNLVAAAGVALLGMFFLPPSTINPFPGMPGGLASGLLVGLLLFWFGTMFPFVIIFVPTLVRMMKPYASQLSPTGSYPEIERPSSRVLWSWSILVAALVLGALLFALFSNYPGVSSIVSGYGGSFWWTMLFVVSAAAIIVVGALLPKAKLKADNQKT